MVGSAFSEVEGVVGVIVVTIRHVWWGGGSIDYEQVGGWGLPLCLALRLDAPVAIYSRLECAQCGDLRGARIAGQLVRAPGRLGAGFPVFFSWFSSCQSSMVGPRRCLMRRCMCVCPSQERRTSLLYQLTSSSDIPNKASTFAWRPWQL